MRLRSLDADGVRAYLDELRPRLLIVRIDAGRVHLRWALPSWAIEEPLRFLLRLIPIATAIAPGLTRRLTGRIGVAGSLAPSTHGPARSSDLWRAVDHLFSEADRDLLHLPADLPFVDVETKDVRVLVGQTRL
jgi:hypothetical protein